MTKLNIVAPETLWTAEDLAKATPAQIMTLAEGIDDIEDLEQLALLSEGERRSIFEDRIGAIKREAPQVGRCIEEKVRDLPVTLTEEEAIRVARKATEEIRKQGENKDTLKAAIKEVSKRIEEQEVIRDRAIRELVEFWPVRVQILLDGDVVRTVRMDTGEVIDVRQATDEETQEPLDFGALR